MRRSQRRRQDSEAAIANFALTFAKAIMVTCVVMMTLISPAKKEDGVKPKMEYLLSLEWPYELDYDVDIWVRDPDGRTLYYQNKQAGFMNLERDDLGKISNTVVVDGKKVSVPNNQELVAIRGILPGEYIVNAHLYGITPPDGQAKITNPQPVPPFDVRLKIEKLNPTVNTVYQGTVTFHAVREELHIVRFTVGSDGEVSNLTKELPVLLRQGLETDETNTVATATEGSR